MNQTHDASLTSWIESANDPQSDFPIQNLPFGVFSRPGSERTVGIAIGDFILDVVKAVKAKAMSESRASRACRRHTLNELMSLPQEELSAFRSEVSRFLSSAGSKPSNVDELIVPIREAELHLPAHIGDYTDFYASIHHATNVGSMFRPDNPLLPNYKYVPIGYHGRSSSIVVSGNDIRRPSGQIKPADADKPTFGAAKMLDYESELGFLIGTGNNLGESIPIDEAAEHIFGFCLVNDWSARDIQSWEYQPLGPFLAKNFATTISPWVVTREAVEPYRVAAFSRPSGDPQPLPYLSSTNDTERGGINLTLEVFLSSEKMREEKIAPVRLSSAAFSSMYWTVAQMLTHHAVNGCNLRSGDLMASGTVSGVTDDSRGCLLELTWRGTKPLRLPTGEERRFLQDGDEVIMRGHLEASGRPHIGFGECRGTILPAH